MEKKINCAVIGNGNLGKACRQQLLKRSDEFNLIGVFSRRVSSDTILLDEIGDYTNQIDVALFCGGSSGDAPKMVPYLNSIGLSTVDSYDNHDWIKNQKYLSLIRSVSIKSGTCAIIGAGWDPGYLSVQRIYLKAIMPKGVQNTFYGGFNGGVSLGHTNAIKSIRWVIAAHQITIPREDAKQAALSGVFVEKEKRHKRICYVAAKEGKEKYIEKKIRNMDGYFKNQEVEIHFINMDEFRNRFANQTEHGGQIISTDDNAKIDLQLEMKSNQIFTAKAMIAFAKANYKMQGEGKRGVFTPDQIPPSYLIDDEKTRLAEI